MKDSRPAEKDGQTGSGRFRLRAVGHAGLIGFPVSGPAVLTRDILPMRRYWLGRTALPLPHPIQQNHQLAYFLQRMNISSKIIFRQFPPEISDMRHCRKIADRLITAQESPFRIVTANGHAKPPLYRSILRDRRPIKPEKQVRRRSRLGRTDSSLWHQVKEARIGPSRGNWPGRIS